MLGVSIEQKELVKSFRRHNNQFLRIIWDSDYLQSEERFDASVFSDSEVGSPIGPVSKVRLGSATASTPHRVTRSRGKARDLPNVQPRILEYN